MQMAQSMPQGAMRVVLNGFFAAIQGIMFRACKKLSPDHFHHAYCLCLYGGCCNRDDYRKTEVKYMRARRIETGTPEGEALGFSGDLFSGWLEMYTDSRLYVHYIISRHRGEGNVQNLIRVWLDCGYRCPGRDAASDYAAYREEVRVCAVTGILPGPVRGCGGGMVHGR